MHRVSHAVKVHLAVPACWKQAELSTVFSKGCRGAAQVKMLLLVEPKRRALSTRSILPNPNPNQACVFYAPPTIPRRAHLIALTGNLSLLDARPSFSGDAAPGAFRLASRSISSRTRSHGLDKQEIRGFRKDRCGGRIAAMRNGFY
jgi:hypothetical protein